MKMKWLLLFQTLFAMVGLVASCYNNCNRHGKCNIYGTCECFSGWAGHDCTQRSCPSGPKIADIASSLDTAHATAECSGRGICDYSTGVCQCDEGFSGRNCGRRLCHNNCSGRGKCVSLSSAATINDGFHLNRTNIYTNWDSDMFYGCVCDFGWYGADCSERRCPYGVDPRSLTYPYESVTLVCECDSVCSGKFKLQFRGQSVGSWLKPTSKAYEVANALMTAPGIAGNNSAHSTIPVRALNATKFDPICANYATTTTTIEFVRSSEDYPAIGFYANLMTSGSVYFETKQMLQCNCLYKFCNGTFRLSFDGEMSEKILSWGNGSQIQSVLSQMKTIQAANVTVINKDSSIICESYAFTNHTIVMRAPVGNLPRLGLWSSVVDYKKPSYYNTDNATDVLTLKTWDGHDTNVKLCNGIGKCDWTTGECLCPNGWGPDPTYGPCGKLEVFASNWGGMARCPGVVDGYMTPEGTREDLSSRRNHNLRLYISSNPAKPVMENTSNYSTSVIEWFPLNEENPILTRLVDRTFTRGHLFMNMSSNSSAGPLVIDEYKQQMFFVDANPFFRFIGIAPLDVSNTTYSRSSLAYFWIRVTKKIFGLTADMHFKRRKIYWSTPGGHFKGDGGIYWAYMDATVPTVYSLVSSIGISHLVDPMGIAIHYNEEKLYWIDKDNSTLKTVLRKCDLDGSNPEDVYAYGDMGNYTVSANSSDLVIDFKHNNTAIFIDTNGYIIATNLNFPRFENNTNNTSTQFEAMQPVRTLLTSLEERMVTPRYLTLDYNSSLLLWSDPGLKAVKQLRYLKARDYPSADHGLSYRAGGQHDRPYIPTIPVGLAIDRGLGPPTWGTYVDCYGNGRCLGLDGNWTCECNKGYFGDCQARECPKGKAWFHEPIVSNIAHDEEVECSNMGTCDRMLGMCQCFPGFEGAACDRLSCRGNTISDTGDGHYQCAGRGRCLPLSEMAKHHKNEYLESSPVQYGSIPNDPTTWDAEMIQGCVDDEYGFRNGSTNFTSGFNDGTELSCPEGFNTRLFDKPYNNSNTGNYTDFLAEKQTLTCLGQSGSFRLSFRGKTSDAIPYSATGYRLQQILQGVPTIGLVKVTVDEGDTAAICNSAASVTTTITFLSVLGGNLALLEVDRSELGPSFSKVTVTRIQTATSDGLQECSGKGTCDRSTGTCVCWPGWVSSDGFGNKGPRGDCGHNTVY